MKKFKIGDKVFVINNEPWGLNPMTVKQIYSDCIICYNESMKRDGGFFPEDLRHFTKGRDNQIKKYVKLKNNSKLTALEESLFGRDCEE